MLWSLYSRMCIDMDLQELFQIDMTEIISVNISNAETSQPQGCQHFQCTNISTTRQSAAFPMYKHLNHKAVSSISNVRTSQPQGSQHFQCTKTSQQLEVSISNDFQCINTSTMRQSAFPMHKHLNYKAVSISNA